MKEIFKFFLPNKNLLKIIIKEKKKNLKKQLYSDKRYRLYENNDTINSKKKMKK